jgi:hypothetical protein
VLVNQGRGDFLEMARKEWASQFSSPAEVVKGRNGVWITSD